MIWCHRPRLPAQPLGATRVNAGPVAAYFPKHPGFGRAPFAPSLPPLPPNLIAWCDQGAHSDAMTQTVLRAALPMAQYGQHERHGPNFFREQPEKARKSISAFLTDAPPP